MPDIKVTITGDARGGVAAIREMDRATDKYRESANNAETSTTRFGGAAGALKTLLPIAAITAGAAAVTKFGVEAAKVGAQSERLGRATDNLGRQFGLSANEIVDAITFASGNTISRMEAMQSANAAMLFGVASSKEEFTELTEIAVALGRAMGQDATKSMDDLTLALGRQSPMILDNLGIQIKLSEAYADYASKLGVTVSQLDESQKQQAFMNAALEAGREKIEEMGGVQEDNLAKMERMSAAYENFKVTVGNTNTVSGLFALSMNFATEALTLFGETAVEVDNILRGLSGESDNNEQAWQDTSDAFVDAADASLELEGALIAAVEATKEQAQETTNLGEELTKFFDQVDKRGKESVTSQMDLNRELVEIHNDTQAKRREIEAKTAEELRETEEEFTERAIEQAQRRARMRPELAAASSAKEIEIAGKTKEEALAAIRSEAELELAEVTNKANEKTRILQEEFFEEKAIREQSAKDNLLITALSLAEERGEFDKHAGLMDKTGKEIFDMFRTGTLEVTMDMRRLVSTYVDEVNRAAQTRVPIQEINRVALEQLAGQFNVTNNNNNFNLNVTSNTPSAGVAQDFRVLQSQVSP